MIRSLGKLKYFKITTENLINLSDNDYIDFEIDQKQFRISVPVLLERLKSSIDWNTNGIHKDSKAVPKWLIKANLFTKELNYSPPASLARASRIWDELISCAKSKNEITYTELAKKLNCHHRPLRYPLGYIQKHLMESNLPPLTILVVGTFSNKPGEGFIARNEKQYFEAKNEVPSPLPL